MNEPQHSKTLTPPKDIDACRAVVITLMGGPERLITGSCAVKHLVAAIDVELTRKTMDYTQSKKALLAWQNLCIAVRGY